MRARRIDRFRRPGELLNRICHTLIGNSVDALNTAWGKAADAAYDDVAPIRDRHYPDPPRRRYFGARGSLSNPHH